MVSLSFWPGTDQRSHSSFCGRVAGDGPVLIHITEPACNHVRHTCVQKDKERGGKVGKEGGRGEREGGGREREGGETDIPTDRERDGGGGGGGEASARIERERERGGERER